MAKTYKWPDGSGNHTITWDQHQSNLAAQRQSLQGTVAFNGQIVTPQNWATLGQQAVTDIYKHDFPNTYQGIDPLTGETKITQDPRIDASYLASLGGLDTTRDNSFDSTRYGVGRGALDYGFGHVDKASGLLSGQGIGDTQTAGSFTDATGGTHKYAYDNYSFDPNGYETGGVADINKAAFDATNPFSKMSMLQQAYEGTKRGTTNGLAARGQLFSGALGHQRGLDHTNASGAFNTLLSAFMDLIHGGNQSNTNTLSDYLTNAGTAGSTRLNQQLGG